MSKSGLLREHLDILEEIDALKGEIAAELLKVGEAMRQIQLQEEGPPDA